MDRPRSVAPSFNLSANDTSWLKLHSLSCSQVPSLTSLPASPLQHLVANRSELQNEGEQELSLERCFTNIIAFDIVSMFVYFCRGWAHQEDRRRPGPSWPRQ